MNSKVIRDKITISVPSSTMLGVSNFSKVLEPSKFRELSVFPKEGKLYIAGLRVFEADDDDDLELTILHPRTLLPLRIGPTRSPIHEVPAVVFNPEVQSRKYNQPESYQGLYIPIADLHEEGNPEPMYCSIDYPLIVQIGGDAPLHLTIVGSDHYTATRWKSEERLCSPKYMGEFQGPFLDSTSTSPES